MDQGGGKKKRKKPTAKSKTRLRPKRVKSRRAQRVLNHRVEKRRRTLRGPAAPRPPPPVNYGSLGSRLSDALSLASLFKQPTPKKKKEPKPPSIEEIVKAVGAYKQPLLELYEKSAERLRNAAPEETAEARKLAQQKLYIKEMIKNATGDVRTSLEETERKIDKELEATLTRANLKGGATILDEIMRTEAVTTEVKQAIERGVANIQGDYKNLQTEFTAKEVEIMEGNARNDDLRAEIDVLQQQKFALQQELERMKQEQEARAKAYTDLQEADMTARELVTEERLNTEQELEKLRKEVEELDAKTRQVDELAEKIKELEQQLEDAKNAAMESEPQPPDLSRSARQGAEVPPADLSRSVPQGAEVPPANLSRSARQGAEVQPEDMQAPVDPAKDDYIQQLTEAEVEALRNITPTTTSAVFGGPSSTDGVPPGAVPSPAVVERQQATQPVVVLATPQGPQVSVFTPASVTPVQGMIPAGAPAMAGPPPQPPPEAAAAAASPSVQKPPEAAAAGEPKEEGEKKKRSASVKAARHGIQQRDVAGRISQETAQQEAVEKEIAELEQKLRELTGELSVLLEEDKDFTEKSMKRLLTKRESVRWRAAPVRKGILKQKIDATKERLENLKRRYGSGRKLGDRDGTTDQELDSKMHKFVPRGFSGVIASDEIKDLKDDVRRGPETSFIMNLDDHTKSGSHWVPVYIRWTNTKSGGPEVDYADSFGDPPSKETVRQLKELVKARRAPYMLKMKVNRIKSQREDSDTCGGHSMRFLHDMYDGKTFKEATGYTVAAAEKLAKRMEGRGGVPRFDYI